MGSFQKAKQNHVRSIDTKGPPASLQVIWILIPESCKASVAQVDPLLSQLLQDHIAQLSLLPPTAPALPYLGHTGASTLLQLLGKTGTPIVLPPEGR